MSGTLSVPVGNYKIMVLAGSKYLNTTLLGSGVADNVEVIQDQRTDVTVNLTNIDSDLKAPTEVICGRDFTISLSGDTSNPILHFPSSYYITDGNNDLVSMSTSTGGQFFESSVTLTAPTTTGTETFKLTGTSREITLVDPSYNINLTLNSNTTVEAWTWLSKFSAIDETHPEISKTVTYVEDPTGIGVTVQW